jgi:hypothetical protein
VCEVFKSLGAQEIALEDSLKLLNEVTNEKVCKSALRTISKQYIWDPVECSTLAYCVAWLRVSGHNSVLPPWVRHRFPGTVPILRQLRDVPCEVRIPTNSSTHSKGNRPLIPRQFVHLSERSDAGGFFLLEVDELVNVGRLFSH